MKPSSSSSALHRASSPLYLKIMKPLRLSFSVVFFASEWSRVVTGPTLDVNGGEYFG